MTLRRARGLAYAVQALLGLYTGLYVNVYIAALGRAGAPLFGSDIDGEVVGITCLSLLFMAEYPLELLGGAVGDRLGHKLAFAVSFLLRSLFSVGMAFLIVWYPPASLVSYVLVVAALTINFAVAFTLLSGNFEIWLRSLCDDHKESDVAFAWSETLFWAGLTVGGTVSFLSTEGVSLVASGTCALVAFLVCLSIQERQGGKDTQRDGHKQQRKHRESSEELWKLVKNAKPFLRSRLPDVDRSFWVLAVGYGLAQSMEALIPAYYVLGDRPICEKLVIVNGCLWFPSLLGAVRRTPVVRKLLPGSSALRSSVFELRSVSLKYALASMLIPVALLIPATADLRVYALGAVVFIARVFYGPFRPVFRNYASGRILKTAECLPDDERRRLGKRTVMSISEQRMKLGAMSSVIPFYFVQKFGDGQTDAYFGAIGFMAFVLAVVALFLLRPNEKGDE